MPTPDNYSEDPILQSPGVRAWLSRILSDIPRISAESEEGEGDIDEDHTTDRRQQAPLDWFHANIDKFQQPADTPPTREPDDSHHDSLTG